MDSANAWYLTIGLLLLLIAVGGSRVARWPISTAMIYLVIGVILGRLGWLSIDFARNARWLEIASEVAVIVSLFSAGLRLRIGLRRETWIAPVLLATLGMALTAALVAGAGVWLLSMPLGVAIVLGALIAPTDPVLASDVQVEGSKDRDRVRSSLTGEAGLNDGTAFPVLFLGLGVLGLRDLGEGIGHWVAVDVLYKVIVGFISGWSLAWLVARGMLYQRQARQEATGFDDFLALGLIAVAYGVAQSLHAYGFIAVFAAGLSLRALERRKSNPAAEHEAALAALPEDAVASDPEHAPAYMAEAVLRFNEQMDRIGELALVVLVGALISVHGVDIRGLALALLLFFVFRPLAIAPLCAISGLDRYQTALVSWFGIRGIGSIYYLAYAVTHGLPSIWVEPLVAITLTVIATSTLMHGVSSTPLMRRYAIRAKRSVGSASA